MEDLATHPTLPDALFRLMHKTQYLNVASSLVEEMLVRCTSIGVRRPLSYSSQHRFGHDVRCDLIRPCIRWCAKLPRLSRFLMSPNVVQACSTKTYDLKEVGCVAELIAGLNDAQLVHFARILTMLIFDADDGVECNRVMKGILADVIHTGGDAHIDGDGSVVPAPKTETARLVSINQELLASTPGLVPRLVGLLRPDGNAALLRQLMRSPEFFSVAMQAAGGGNFGGGDGGGRSEVMVQVDLARSPPPPVATDLGSESDRQRWAQMFRAETDSDQYSNEPDILASIQSMLDHPDAIRIYPQQQNQNRYGGDDAGGISDGTDLQRVSHSLYMCEILFVLCTLVSSNRKKEVQRTMVEERLAPILSELFDSIVWGGKQSARGGVHGPDCGCCPESALKIQFLRLVRHFCENGDDYSGKRTMLSRNELTKLAVLADTHEEPPSTCEFYSNGIEAEMYCDGERGLLSKLAGAFMAKENNEEFLIFLANSLEGYLRGAPGVDRIFLVEQGVLKHVAGKVLALWDTRKTTGKYNQGLLQSMFDLLGELVKFSSSVMSILDDDLDDKQFVAIMSYTTTNLVASNVFIRSLCLTSQELYCPAGRPVSRFVSFVRLNDNTEKLVTDLIMSVTMKDLNEENICCVSTCIIFFIVANRADKLPALLEALRFRNGTFPGSTVLSNCRGLLSFWRRYYSSGRSRDCQSLECNSKIKFDEWVLVVNELLLPEEAGRRSLAFWQHGSRQALARESPAHRPPVLAVAGTGAGTPGRLALADRTRVNLC